MQKYILFLLISTTAPGCSPLKISTAAHSSGLDWLSPGGALEQTNFRPRGPVPPLVLRDVVSLTAAPVQNLAAIDSTILIATKNGRIYAYRLGRGKSRAKIKLPESVSGAISAHKSGLMAIGLAIGRETLVCYDLRKGKVRWKQRAGLLASEPVIADSSVYVVARFKHVDRYNLRNGRRFWRFDLESQAHTAPTLHGKYLAFGTDRGEVFVLDRSNGKKIWQRQSGAAIFASPSIANDHLYAVSTDSTVRAYRLRSGKLLWAIQLSGRLRRTPAIAGELLIVGAGDGSVYGLDKLDGSKIWRFRARSGISTSPLVVGRTVYFGALDRYLYALDVQTGAEIWKTRLRGRVRTNPIAVGEHLIVGSEDKYVYVFAARDQALANE